jgi:hypothetical protein
VLDTGEFAAGGLRLPAPMWGYASYGYPGAVLWSFLSGVFIGWGSTLLRRLVTPFRGQPGQALNLILAWVFFQGTFFNLGNFYFPERVEIVGLALALALCWSKTMHLEPVAETAGDGETDAPVGARVAH